MTRVTRYCFVVFAFLFLNGSMVHSENSPPWMEASRIMTRTLEPQLLTSDTKFRGRERSHLTQDKIIPSGTYAGFLGADHLKRADLIIREGNNEDYSFTLEIKGQGEPTFGGRITVEKQSPEIPPGPGPNARKFKATIRFGSTDVNKYFSWNESSSPLSVEGEVKENNLILRSLDNNRPFLFITCLPYPGCKEQPQCQPCQ